MTRFCPVCSATASATATAATAATLRPFAALRGVPVHCNVLHPDAASAATAPRGDIVLGFCDACTLVHNLAFDPSLLQYDQEYENSLHFSPRFQAYAEDLAVRLLAGQAAARADSDADTGIDILEIGCGKGEFLGLLTADGRNRCVGFDASFEPDKLPPNPQLSIRSEFFSPDTHRERADLLISRHVLEHIADPVAFVRDVGRGLKPGPRAALFFEVPNGLWTLADLGIWDLIYEHCSYFTRPALAQVFRAAGFVPQRLTTSFENQFLCIEASPTASPADAFHPAADEIADIARLADAFGHQLEDKLAHWESVLAGIHARGEHAVVWGAGSKGVTFLNVLPSGRHVTGVIDINPRKTGKHVAGTGQRIEPPEWLVSHPADVVLVMNPAYEGEIQARLAELGMGSITRTMAV
jgi:SAM-dependent methyltransferase